MPNDLHLKAEGLREVGDFDEALVAYQKALNQYLKEENYAEAAESFGGISLTYRLLWEASESQKIYLIIARHYAYLSLRLMIRYRIKDRIHRAYQRMADVELLRRHYRHALFFYRVAHKLAPVNTPEKSNIQINLGFAEYKCGLVESGLLHLFLAQQELEKSPSDLESYVYNVWLSGANMRLAEALIQEDPKTSYIYFQKALDIINSDDRLTLRRTQLEKLGNRLHYPPQNTDS